MRIDVSPALWYRDDLQSGVAGTRQAELSSSEVFTSPDSYIA